MDFYIGDGNATIQSEACFENSFENSWQLAWT